jgi:hypothetical protein
LQECRHVGPGIERRCIPHATPRRRISQASPAPASLMPLAWKRCRNALVQCGERFGTPLVVNTWVLPNDRSKVGAKPVHCCYFTFDEYAKSIF